MNIETMFNEIERYHKQLGYDPKDLEVVERMTTIQQGGLALYQEVAELIDSFPWKPWRLVKDQNWDRANAIVEIVDIIFFLGLIMEAAYITGEEVQIMFYRKHQENYNRIDRGYNNKPDERG